MERTRADILVKTSIAIDHPKEQSVVLFATEIDPGDIQAGFLFVDSEGRRFEVWERPNLLSIDPKETWAIVRPVSVEKPGQEVLPAIGPVRNWLYAHEDL